MTVSRSGNLPVCFLLLASPAFAQFELQILDPAPRTAPALYDLGPTYTTDSLTAHFRLRNTGAASLTASTLTVAGVGFSMTAPNLPVTVDPQVALEFSVTFRSPDLGGYSAVLRAENVTVLLTASVQPRLTYRIENTSLGAIVDFGSAQSGVTVGRQFTVLNETPVLLTIPAISLSGADFSFAATPPSGIVLAPQQSAAFVVNFVAATAGIRAAILAFGDRSAVLTALAIDPPLPRPILSVDLLPAASAQQGNLIITLDPPAAISGVGTATLDFRGSADPSVAFAAGERTTTFKVASGDSRVILPFQTGTTAGTLIFSARLGDTSDMLALQIPTNPPVLTQVQGLRTAQGVEVRVTGWDNTHSVSQLSFLFYDAAGIPAGPAVRVDASADFAKYYAVSDAGGTFSLRAAFPVTGEAAQIVAVEVSLTDLIGTAKSARTPIL